MKKIKIYTKFGDKGQTQLYDSSEISKTNKIIKTLGLLDKFTSYLSICSHKTTRFKKEILKVQKDIYHICSSIAMYPRKRGFLNYFKKDSPSTCLLEEKRIKYLETFIDQFIPKNDKPNFIQPGSTEEAAFYHYARTLCREVEISLWELNKEYIVDENILIYVNRLSDALYIIARRLEDHVIYLEMEKSVENN